MKKLLFACLCTAAFSTGIYAQKGDININAGVDIALPTGDFGEVYNMGFGATVKGLYGISENGQIGLTLGYIRFGLKDEYDENLSGSLGIIPVFAVYRHHFGNLYVEPQIGFSSNKVKLETETTGWGSFGGSASETSFGYAAGIGYMLGDIDLSARYQGLSQGGSGMGFLAVRAAYNFSL
ncbi:outer membrane beta-barrel protein [Sinomicrobium soli]|uniref:outer membrane beta-barrel protein n=1 Tax=Sinomicrobium sp. N-1-3-6 TaxID=2219864 RepID=UPI001374CA59|nr:outer membrane beta-barrel protein [Sinomicrobium sp. N-1-3-6]